MPELKIRRGGKYETQLVSSIEEFQSLLGGLGNKDVVSWDSSTWTPKKKLKGDSLGIFFERRPSEEGSQQSQTEVVPESESSPSPISEGRVVASQTRPQMPVLPASYRKPVIPESRQSAAAAGLELKQLREEMESRFRNLDLLLETVSSEDRLATQIDKVATELRLVLEKQVESVTRRVDEALARDEEVKELTQDQYGATVRLATKHQFGTVQILEQERDKLREEFEALRTQSREKDSKIDGLEAELRRLKNSTMDADLEELDTKSKRLQALASDLQSREVLHQENIDLRGQLAVLEGLKVKYETHQEAFRSDAELRAEHIRVTSQLEDLQAKVAEGRATRLTLDQERQKTRGLRDVLAECRSVLEKERAENSELREQQEELGQKLKEYSELCITLQKERSELLRQNERTLSAERARIQADLQRNQEERFVAQTAELEQASRTIRMLQEANQVLEDSRNSLMNSNQERLLERQALEQDLNRLAQQVQALEAQREDLEATIRQYRDDLADISPKRLALIDSLEEDHRARRAELDTLFNLERQKLEAKLAEIDDRAHERQVDVAQLAGTKESLVEATNHLREELEHLKAQREVTLDKEQRTASIHESVLEPKPTEAGQQDEIEWLDGVANEISAAGFSYPRRLLEAFHTSLKIASWSPITALAGVSGTGKSELPRLYAHCGGMHFLPVSVQPNWDSPQDLFGFFNYMDGRYKATEFLRSLVQSSTIEPFKDQMLVVLLDEMNLARVEQYFSEILSKLGSVRDSSLDTSPFFSVDVGMGGTEKISLRNNVLYVGTMNEDETTHILSDKVLDRGNVLTFPRPKELKSRGRVTVAGAPMAMSAQTWQAWICESATVLHEAGIDQQIKEALQNVNRALGKVNRAIGHRVLQAIEAYVANHPRTRSGGEAWKKAFGDQLAQRVMPKLRGLENDGVNEKDCIDQVDRIISQITPDLKDDFNHARDPHVSRTFRWDSAEYLNY